MALKKGFYDEIFDSEEKWDSLIKSNLLNIIYCNLELKPFYLSKKEELVHEYEITNNAIIKQVLDIINNIISEIDVTYEKYNSGESVDINYLSSLFLINQMRNSEFETEKKDDDKKELDTSQKDDDYLYDY